MKILSRVRPCSQILMATGLMTNDFGVVVLYGVKISHTCYCKTSSIEGMVLLNTNEKLSKKITE